MTTSNSSTWHDGAESGGRGQERIGVSGPGDLIVALPAMLGFVPQDSLLTVLLGGASGREVIATMRLDLGPALTDPDVLDAVAARLGGMHRDEPFDVLIVIVDGAWEHGGAPADGSALRHLPTGSVQPEECHGWLVRALARRLAHEPVGLAGALLTSSVREGSPFTEVLGAGRSGRLPDPRASDVTAAHVVCGRTVHPSREDMEDVLAPDPPAERTTLMRAIRDCEPTVLQDRHAGPGHALLCEASDVLKAIGLLAAGEQPGAAALARAALAIECRRIRDAALGATVAAVEPSGAYHDLWLLLTRRLDGPRRAEAAVLLAFGLYAHGDGPLAQAAVDRALDADPTHRLAARLDEALSLGVHPERIRELAGDMLADSGPLADMFTQALRKDDEDPAAAG